MKLTKSEQKIIKALTAINTKITAAALATAAEIDIKNLSKSTKTLIQKQLITERIEQAGKVRTKYYSPAPPVPATEPLDQSGSDWPVIPAPEPPKTETEPEQMIPAPQPLEIPIETFDQRTREILTTRKPRNSKNRKAVTDYYIKKRMLTMFEATFATVGLRIKLEDE